MSLIPLQPVELSDTAYQQLTDNSLVLERDSRADKVLQLTDGTFLKLFRTKTIFSSATLSPYSKRFIKNAYTLQKAGVETVTPLAFFKIPSIDHTAVQYTPLAGKTLRQVISDSEFKQGLAFQLGKFISTLHKKGIYFRSLHLGNIVLTPQGSLGLIDVADMTFKNRALFINERIRNFNHMFRYMKDKQALGNECLINLIKEYLNNALLSTSNTRKVSRKLTALSSTHS